MDIIFSDVYQSINYIMSLAKFTWTPLELKLGPCEQGGTVV